jgi:hypothetical protein
MDELEEAIDEIPNYQNRFRCESGKIFKQAYYNGKPEYYDLQFTRTVVYLSYAKNATKTRKTT